MAQHRHVRRSLGFALLLASALFSASVPTAAAGAEAGAEPDEIMTSASLSRPRWS